MTMSSDTQRVRQTRFNIALLVVLALFAAAPAIVHAQVHPEIANCDELKDEGTKTLSEMCSAHLGCKLVFVNHKTCASAKQFLGNLNNAIGEGTRGSFGFRKEITADAIFEASLTDKTRVLDTLPETKELASSIRQRVREVRGETITGQGKLGQWVFYGEVKDGKANGIGTMVQSAGISRGAFSAYVPDGRGEMLLPDLGRIIGEYRGGFQGYGGHATPDGRLLLGRFRNSNMAEGKYVQADGTRFEGRFETLASGAVFPSEGKVFRADGSIASEGRYEGGRQSVGKLYDSSGTTVVSEVDLPRDRELAAATAKEAAEQRKRDAEEQRLAAERHQRDEQARAAQVFRDSLNKMNPGQLFARADELSSQGDQTRSREVQRALISRFPSHNLAKVAAEQLASSASNRISSSAGAAGAGAPTGSFAGAAGGGSSPGATSGSDDPKVLGRGARPRQ